mmetsp:Transcript_433/g.1509  ORF Transcript_433/g.1509 Transcript_433/m.1509 type:complete len:232 (-) Transcript_433:2115-2810(-)
MASSKALACSSVLGKPSMRKHVRPPSISSMRSRRRGSVTQPSTMRPCLNVSLMTAPASLSLSASSRSSCPAEHVSKLQPLQLASTPSPRAHLSVASLHTVPLPLPGPPRTNTMASGSGATLPSDLLGPAAARKPHAASPALATVQAYILPPSHSRLAIIPADGMPGADANEWSRGRSNEWPHRMGASPQWKESCPGNFSMRLSLANFWKKFWKRVTLGLSSSGHVRMWSLK